jgi:hypothetical protein
MIAWIDITSVTTMTLTILRYDNVSLTANGPYLVCQVSSGRLVLRPSLSASPAHSHKMSTEPLQPSTPLPLEIKGEILSFADTDTLARACSVSLAFLELAAPLLYRDITFVGPMGLTKFLTLRVSILASFLPGL